ncbi:MAG: asparagine synthase-related protein [Burkholderiales bacterium]
MPLDSVRTPEATATREPGSVPVAQTAGEPFVLIEERDGRTVVSGAPSCTLGRETPLWEGRPDGIFARWAWDGSQLQLENDRYGLQPLYYFSDKGRCALSPSVSKLIELGAPSDLDFEALAVFLHLGYFLGDETPFRAIRAVPPNASCRWSQGALTVEGRRPRVAAVRLGRDEALAAYVASFREAIRRRPPESDDVVHLLSGGRDSRHILFELQHNGHAPRTCLTVAYGGGDTEVARLVAEALGIEHVAVPGGEQTLAAERRKNALTHFCADEHTWVLAAADYLARRPTTLYDGLGGDVLSAGLFLSPKRLRLYEEGRFLDLARDLSVGSVVLPMFRRDMRERLANAAPLSRIAQALESMAGEPNPVSAFCFWNRTRREIALGPYRMLCNNAVVHSPYVDAGVYDLLMGMPAATFVDHTFHTDAINLAFPQHRHLPYAGKTPDGIVSWRRGARIVLDLLGSSIAPGNHLVDRGFLVPRLMRALVDPTYRPALHWLAQLTVYLEQLGELQAPTAGAQRVSRSNSSRSN